MAWIDFSAIESPTSGVNPERPRTRSAKVALGFAVAGLALAAMAGCGGPIGLVALVLGIRALGEIKRYPARYAGRKSATAATLLGALAMAVAIPAGLWEMARGQEMAMRAVVAANLRGIAQGISIYASENAGAYPPDLDALVSPLRVTPKQLLDWSSGHAEGSIDFWYVADTPPAKATTGELAVWIVAYSDAKYHYGDGAPILYADKHVEFVKEPRFSQEIARFKEAFRKANSVPAKIIPPR